MLDVPLSAIKGQMEREYGFVALDLDYLDDVGDLPFGTSSSHENLALADGKHPCVRQLWFGWALASDLNGLQL